MENMPALVQYLLAVQKKGGNKLVQHGYFSVTIPVFPPGMTLGFDITPYFGEYCSIQILHQFSPAVVPGAFDVDVHHKGLHVQIGLLDQLFKRPLFTWAEVTVANPIVSTFINISGLSQYLGSVDEFLIVNSEEDYYEIMRLVREWGAMDFVERLKG